MTDFQEPSFKEWFNSLVKAVLWPVWFLWGLSQVATLAVAMLVMLILVVAIFVVAPIVVVLSLAGVDVCWDAVFPACREE